jgi:hypothetical protein
MSYLRDINSSFSSHLASSQHTLSPQSTMHLHLLSLLLAASVRAASITCHAPLSHGSLYYSSPTSRTYIGQLGIIETRGVAEQLEKYPNPNVIAHNVSIVPCNSSSLSAIPNASSKPVLLKLVDDPSQCLALISAGINAEVTIIKGACQTEDTVGNQQAQFWTLDRKKLFVVPQ